MDEQPTRTGESAGDFDRGFDGQRRRQARLGLALSPVERLRWLERTMAELRAIQGRARSGRPVSPLTQEDAELTPGAEA